MNYEKDIRTASDHLQKLLDEHKKDLETIAKNIIKISERVEDSWSGSWVGYHANLYFGNYDKPGPRQMFSVEWGGINGYDPAWQSKSLDEVWEYINKSSSTPFDLDEANDKINEIQEAAQGLKTVLELNTKHSAPAEKIKDIDVDYTMHDFIKSRSPSSIVSRDSEAVMQGMKLPPHIQCQSFAYTIRQNISGAEKLIKMKSLVGASVELPSTIKLIDDELSHLEPALVSKVGKLYQDKHYAEAAGKAFSVVKDRLRDITGFENGFPAFNEGRLYIKGAAADNVDDDFQEAVRRLLGAIDKFRNEKFHTSEATIADKSKALSYLHMCSLALIFLADGNYTIKAKLRSK